MKTKQLLAGVGILFLLLVACKGEEEKGRRNPLNVGFIGDARQFWVLDYKLDPYSVKAVLRAEGKHSKIWIEEGLLVEDSTLSSLVAEYDNHMRPAMDVFSLQGPLRDETDQIIAQNSLELADYFGDGDGKLSILIVDMSRDPNMGFIVVGYFYPGDFFQQDTISHSNESDIIYLNARLGVGSPAFNKTLVHEMQHLMNYVNSIYLRSYIDLEGYWGWEETDVWVNEGLSAAAEYIYSGQHNEERLERFNDPEENNGNAIVMGNNFFVWNDRPDKILDEYATVYLFFQWLRLQSGGTDIYQAISVSKLADHRAVLHALRGKGNYRLDSNLTWDTLLRDWLAANFLTTDDFERFPLGTVSEDVKHSYMKDPLLSTIRPRCIGGDSVVLLPGEGVYSYTTAATPYAPTNNIRYTGLKAGTVTNHSSIAGGYLLSYNINTENDLGRVVDLRESARISSELPPECPPSRASATRGNMHASRLSASKPPAEPQPISLWDMLYLRGDKRAYAPIRKPFRAPTESD